MTIAFPRSSRSFLVALCCAAFPLLPVTACEGGGGGAADGGGPDGGAADAAPVIDISITEDDLHDFVFVAAHPYNAFDDDDDPAHTNWARAFTDYRIDYLDRNNTFNASYYRNSFEADDIYFTASHGIPSSSYYSLYPIFSTDPQVSTDWMFQGQYQHFLDSELWTDPYGNLIPRTADIIQAGAVLDLAGQPVAGHDPGRLHISLANPNWLKYQKDSMTFSLSLGIRGFNWDFLSVSLFGLSTTDADYSEWAIVGFREHLRNSFGASELTAMGIADIDSFSIKEYRETHDPTDQSGDLVFKHYFLWMNETQLQFMRELQDHARTLGAQAGSFLPVFGNLFIGTPEIGSTLWGYAKLMLAQHCDLIQLESEPSVFTRNQAGVSTDLDPHQNHRHALNYRIGHAMAGHGKPVWSLPVPFSTDVDRGVGDVTQLDYANIQKLFLAEGYAMDVIPEIDLGGWPGGDNPTWSYGVYFENGSTVPEVVEYVEFIDDHRDLFTRVESRARVAILLSFPTLLWNNWGLPGDPPGTAYDNQGFWGRNYFQHRSALVGYASALDHLQRVYDVVLLSHPDFWDDRDALDRLDRYDVLVLPLLSHLSDAQVAAITAWAGGPGRTLIVIGDPGSQNGVKDENDGDRAPWLPGLSGLATVPLFDVLDYAVEQRDITPAMLAPLGATPALVELGNAGDPRTIGVNLTVKGARTIVHLVSYDYDFTTDSFPAKTGFTLSLDAPAASAATFYSPDTGEVIALPVTDAAGRKAVTVPSLQTWSFVVFE